MLNHKDLSEAFEINIPENLILTDSYVDAITETEPFRNIKWTEVNPELLKNNFEVAFFFSPEAFYYFLPAFINCSLKDLNKTQLALDNLLQCMSVTDNLLHMEFRKTRWQQLSITQWDIIAKWILWLQSTPNANELNNLESAIEAIKQEAWPKSRFLQ